MHDTLGDVRASHLHLQVSSRMHVPFLLLLLSPSHCISKDIYPSRQMRIRIIYSTTIIFDLTGVFNPQNAETL